MNESTNYKNGKRARITAESKLYQRFGVRTRIEAGLLDKREWANVYNAVLRKTKQIAAPASEYTSRLRSRIMSGSMTDPEWDEILDALFGDTPRNGTPEIDAKITLFSLA